LMAGSRPRLFEPNAQSGRETSREAPVRRDAGPDQSNERRPVSSDVPPTRGAGGASVIVAEAGTQGAGGASIAKGVTGGGAGTGAAGAGGADAQASSDATNHARPSSWAGGEEGGVGVVSSIARSVTLHG